MSARASRKNRRVCGLRLILDPAVTDARQGERNRPGDNLRPTSANRFMVWSIVVAVSRRQV